MSQLLSTLTTAKLYLLSRPVIAALTAVLSVSALADRPFSCSGAELIADGGCELSMQGISFTLRVSGNSSINQLKLSPRGLKIDNREQQQELDGTASGAEVADLDGNGWPEIYLYVNSAGSGSYGSLVAYAVNAGKSLSGIYMPPINNHPETSSGYLGHDEFAVIENRLARRFPLYLPGDNNAAPSGLMRQIQYRLQAGEAGWLLVVDRVIDY